MQQQTEEFVSFGEWVRRRRKMLDFTRVALADLVACSADMIKKIERDERRPSLQLAELLAKQLQIPEQVTEKFLQMARGKYVPTLGSPLDLPAAAPAEIIPANLPQQLTSFIGRVEEVAQIMRLIRDEPTCRLLTLVGPGGIGKTRLALQAAAQAIESFPDGVYFVSLAPLSTAESALPTMADALSFPLSGSNPKEQLLNYLSKETVLLLLDNFEHLIPLGVTDLLSEMIIRAPRIKLLVTSRERLNLQQGWGLEVSGLRFPTGAETEETSLEAYEGIQLFVERAQRARPDFTLSRENGAYIVRIGQLVRGMPLGLELAATWLRMMTCREITQEIERGLDFLTTSLRDVPERHQSLRAVFEQSWRLLTKEERAVFRKLSVFRGGFRRRAAGRVAGASLPLLSSLVDKSLLRRTRAGRYEIHELLRQYAAENHSEKRDEREQTQNRRADYYLTFLQQRTDDLKREQGKQAIAVITEDIDNVRAAWSWAITQRNIVTLRKAAYGLTLFYDIRGWFPEGEAAFRQAIETLTVEQELAPDTYNSLMAQMLLGKGWFSVGIGLLEPGQKLLKQSVTLLRQAGPDEQPQVAHALFRLAQSYIFQGDYGEAKKHSEESLTIYTKVGDPWGIGNARWILSVVALYQGAYAETNQLLEENALTLRQLGDHKGLASSIFLLGLVARTRGEYARAERFLEESLQISRSVGHRLGDGYELRELGFLAMALGNYPQAKERMQESLEIFKDLGWRTASVFPLDGLGSIARLQGDYQQAEQLHQESLAICQEIGEGRGIALCLYNLGRLAYDMEDYPTAEQRLQESLTQYKEIGNQHGVASALCRLGYVACASGSERHQEAGQCFNQALEIAAKIDAPPLTLDILVGLATLWVADEPEKVEQERAIELLALVLHHPASEQETKDKAGRLLAELVSSLPPALATAAQERGKAGKLDTILMEVLETAA